MPQPYQPEVGSNGGRARGAQGLSRQEAGSRGPTDAGGECNEKKSITTKLARAGLAASVAAAMVASPALAYKMVGRGQPASGAKSGLTVTPAIDWNRMQAQPGRNAES